jgi:hypothetical protein
MDMVVNMMKMYDFFKKTKISSVGLEDVLTENVLEEV